MPIGGLGYLVGPLVALAVMVVLGLVMRWAFGTARSGRAQSQPADDGLLTKIATLSGRESALALRAVLSDAGIRSTVRYPDGHRAVILVFPEDADRARVVALSFGGPPEN